MFGGFFANKVSKNTLRLNLDEDGKSMSESFEEANVPEREIKANGTLNYIKPSDSLSSLLKKSCKSTHKKESEGELRTFMINNSKETILRCWIDF